MREGVEQETCLGKFALKLDVFAVALLDQIFLIPLEMATGRLPRKRRRDVFLGTQTAHEQGLAAIIGVDVEGFGRLYAVSFGGHDDYLLKAWVLKKPHKDN